MLQTNAIDTVTWRRIKDLRSVEEAKLEASDVGYRFAGTILSAESGLPLRQKYEISWDRDWRAQQCAIEQMFGGVHSLCALRNTGQRWFVNGVEDSALDGCVDIDLGISPSTNTSAINRLKAQYRRDTNHYGRIYLISRTFGGAGKIIVRTNYTLPVRLS